MTSTSRKILFLVNPGSGTSKINWSEEIKQFFEQREEEIELFELPNPCSKDIIAEKIKTTKPDLLVAVGGDGTLKLAVECLNDKTIPIGVLPAGSANGMATELGIPPTASEALQVLIDGKPQPIHLTKVNDELCIHLSDLGFNAYVVKKFDEEKKRGMWTYVKAAWKVLRQYNTMQVELKIKNEQVVRAAAMVVIANATQYGNGVVINPLGKLNDQLFEVVVIRKVSFLEIFKMRFTQRNFNPKKTEFFQTDSLHIQSKKKEHFQVDGEYLGKTAEIKASVLPDAIQLMLPVGAIK